MARQDRMLFRLTRSDGVVLLEQEVTLDPGRPEAAAEVGADQANAAAEHGYGWRLEVSDPDGVLAPVGKWMLLASLS